jgi:hypothetical protein
VIYRVHFYDEADGSQGFAYHTNRRDADRVLAAWKADAPDMRTAAAVEAIETPRNKAGWLALLRQFGSHADNG